MKSLFFLAAFTFNICVNPAINSSQFDLGHAFSSIDLIIDSIVTDDDIMLVSTSPSNSNINDVKVFDSYATLVFQHSGCNYSSCSFDLSSLSIGRYTVDVETTNGYSFTGSIELK